MPDCCLIHILILPGMCCQSDVTKWWKMISWLRVTLLLLSLAGNERALSVHGFLHGLFSGEMPEQQRSTTGKLGNRRSHSHREGHLTRYLQGGENNGGIAEGFGNRGRRAGNWVHVLEVLCNRQRINEFALPWRWGRFVREIYQGFTGNFRFFFREGGIEIWGG